MFRLTISFLLLVIMQSAPWARAQAIDAVEFEAFIEDTLAASNVPGAAVVVWDGEDIVFEKAFGRADADGTAVTLDTPFQLGSISKSFAALVLVQLAAEGSIDLDAPVVTYLPEFQTRNEEVSRRITIRHILSHRSGFATLEGNRIHITEDRSAGAINLAVASLAKVKLKSEPGGPYEYSNANYMIAAAVIEAVSGETYEMVMETRVFGPLGMSNSYIQISAKDTKKEAVGFRQWFGKSVAFPNIAGRAYVAAGGATASARDLAVYMQAVASGDPRIVPAEFADELTARQNAEDIEGYDWDYGLGWMILSTDQGDVVYHSGLNGGFSTQGGFYRSGERGAVVLTNQSGILQADVPGVIVRKSLNLPTGPARPAAGQYWGIWGLALTALVLLGCYILSTIRFAKAVREKGRVSLFRRAAPALVLFGLAYFLAVIIPSLNHINLSGIRIFYPDLWLCLTASALIAMLWGVTRLVYPRGVIQRDEMSG